MFAFLTESSFVYQHLYHVSPNQYAWIFALNIITMMSFNRVTAWRLKTGTHPQNILKWGIIVQFCRQSADDGFGYCRYLCRLCWALVPCVMFSVGTQAWSERTLRPGFYELFQRRGWQRKCGFRRIPIPYRRIGRHGNDLAAQWFRLGDDRYDVEFDRVRYRAVVDLLASGLGGNDKKEYV